MKVLGFVVFYLLWITVSAAVPDSECQIVFKAWEQASGSKSTETDCCQLKGILCSTDHVEAMYLFRLIVAKEINNDQQKSNSK
jgi:hypothetical protein